MAKHRRRSLGLSPEAHATDARNWRHSADNIIKLAQDVMTKNPCGSIEHFTDAIAEGTVATVQFHQAGDEANADAAQRFVSKATRLQRVATKRCRLKR